MSKRGQNGEKNFQKFHNEKILLFYIKYRKVKFFRPKKMTPSASSSEVQNQQKIYLDLCKKCQKEAKMEKKFFKNFTIFRPKKTKKLVERD